jgi:hypothetical protein
MLGDYSTSERYFDASKERFNAAWVTYEANEYGSALYLAGLLIESALMAFVPGPVLGGIRAAHDLRTLSNAGLGALIDDSEHASNLAAALTTAQLRWRSVYRYYPSEYIASLINKRALRIGLIAPFDKSASNSVIGNAQVVGALADSYWSKRRA